MLSCRVSCPPASFQAGFSGIPQHSQALQRLTLRDQGCWGAHAAVSACAALDGTRLPTRTVALLQSGGTRAHSPLC